MMKFHFKFRLFFLGDHGIQKAKEITKKTVICRVKIFLHRNKNNNSLFYATTKSVSFWHYLSVCILYGGMCWG